MHRFFLIVLFCLAIVGLEAQEFSSQPVPDSVFRRMQGRSWPEGCSVRRADLRYLRLSHFDAEKKEHVGEMVCNKAIANDLLDIFRELYRQKYPIQRIRLIDDYEADDERSMQANNTSCFCYRTVAGSKKLSKHAQGMAIDINPLYNPCVKGRRVQPANAREYADRSKKFRCKITANDLCYQLFIQHGFKWGGAWNSLKDYQHFEK